MSVDSTRKSLTRGAGPFGLAGLLILLCGIPCRSQQIPADGAANDVLSGPQIAETFPLPQQASQQPTGSITGTIVDQTGARITGASVKLVREGESSGIEVLSDE